MTSKNPIVIVDDDSDDRGLIKDAFLEHIPEREFVLLENGDLLLEFLKSVPDDEFPALILLDLNMPGKDGREALKEIKNDAKIWPFKIEKNQTNNGGVIIIAQHG